jgi:ABC-type multidrug transport system ATPase subunit
MSGLLVRDVYFPEAYRLAVVPPRVVIDPFLRYSNSFGSQRGTTVLMSTHLLNIAEELADRIGIIHHGKLIALGTLAELRAQHEERGTRLEDIFLSMVEEKE